MSRCEEMQALISQLLDSELSENEAALVQEHIAACDDCRAMYQAFSAVSAAMDSDEPLPDGLHEKIMTTVRTADKALHTQKKLVYLRRTLSLAACLVVVVGTVLALGNTFGRMGRTNSAPMAPSSSSGSTMTSASTSSYALSGGTSPKEENKFYFTSGSLTDGTVADQAAPESVEVMSDADAADDCEATGETPMETAASEPVAAGTSEPLMMTVELRERVNDLTYAATVKECADNVFPAGGRILLHLEEDAVVLGHLDGMPQLAEVTYSHWDDGHVYVSSITSVE